MSKFIDKIFYINMEKRKDRRELIEDELNKFNLDYERFDAIETAEFGIYGCGLSHLSVLKLAKERNYKNVLILEDDFTFSVTKEEFENELTKFFEQNLEYDVCMLSYNLVNFKEMDNDIVGKLVYATTASGYLVNNHYYDILIKLYEWALPLLIKTREHWIYANDQIWHLYQNNDKWFYFKKRIGKQRNGYSDTAMNYMSYNC